LPRSGASLPAFQRWFQDELFRPYALPRRAPRARPSVASVVLPSRTLSPVERVAIYQRGIFARLHDCLAEDFPTIRRLLGDDAFHRLARAYLTRFPSRHYSLNVLGRDLPRFLSRPVRVARRALLRDVARLEDAMAAAFDDAEAAPLPPSEFAAIPVARWGAARLRFIPAFRLLALDHPVSGLVAAAARGDPLPSAPRRPTFVAVYRKGFQVWRADLTRAQHALLRALHRGRTLLQAIAAAARASREPIAERIGGWFQEWVSEGLFSAVELPGRRDRRRG